MARRCDKGENAVEDESCADKEDEDEEAPVIELAGAGSMRWRYPVESVGRAEGADGAEGAEEEAELIVRLATTPTLSFSN